MKLTNEIRSQREVAAFKARKRPHKHYFAYLTSAQDNDGATHRHRIITWMGDTLATVTTIRFRTVRNSWTTNQRGSFWARGIDGRLYWGTHNGCGMFCRMHLAKVQS